MVSKRPTRRRLLRFGGIAAVAVGTGCLHDGGQDGEGNESEDDGSTDGSGDGMQDGEDDGTGNETGDTTEDGGGGGEQHTVTVGPGGSLSFDPDSLQIEPGDTVEFVWDSGGHTVTPVDQPDGESWEGVQETQDSGYSHSHTFDVEGVYSYECDPHGAMGMTGEILVGVESSE